MFFSQQRNQTRQPFFTVWGKLQNKLPLLPLEAQIADVIKWHPEYAPILKKDENATQDYSIEKGQSNPFLHMGMHLALREQLGTNRPQGITTLHADYCTYFLDAHTAEHNMMETLGEILWDAQRNGTAPNEQAYLELLKQRLPAATRTKK